MTDKRLTHEEDGIVIACPECDEGGKVYERTGVNTYAGNPDDPYHCGNCGSTFEEYVDREDKRAEHGTPAKYEHLSPEDVGLE